MVVGLLMKNSYDITSQHLVWKRETFTEDIRALVRKLDIWTFNV